MWQSFTMWLRIACLLLGLSCSTPASVFQGRDQAHSLLDRAKRAYSGWMEELKAGNLERECLEEVCSYEEAREVFEHDQATDEFWKLYNVADYCHSSPCQNNGTCSNQPSSYGCLCPLGFSGRNCELEFKLVPDTCLHENGGCEHFCEEGGGSRNCSCAAGYVLAADGQRCLAEEMYPCGTVPVLQGILSEKRNLPDDPRSRIVGGTECPRGHCPWQVLLVYGQKGFCGGVIYTATWILTATHCLENIDVRHLKVVAGEHNLDVEEGSEQTVQVVEMVLHPAYVVKTADNDIALLRLAEPIRFSPYAVPACLPRRVLAEQELWAVHLHTVSGWGRCSELGPTSRILRKLDVPRIRTQDCVKNSGVSITANMFCAGYIEGKQDSCKGDSGGPLVTRYRQTWFLLGIVSWGKGCARPGNYGIYTRVSNYLDWIHEHTAKRAVNGTETKILSYKNATNLQMFY